MLHLSNNYLMPALKAALTAFQINILHSQCVQGLLGYFESIASTLCLYEKKNWKHNEFVLCILLFLYFLFCRKSAIWTNRMQYNLQSQTKPSIFTYGYAFLNISSSLQFVTGCSGWVSCWDSSMLFVCGLTNAISLAPIPEVIFVFPFFVLCAHKAFLAVIDSWGMLSASWEKHSSMWRNDLSAYARLSSKP